MKLLRFAFSVAALCAVCAGVTAPNSSSSYHGIDPTCALCAAIAAGVGMTFCLAECALAKGLCPEMCQQTIASITAIGGFCGSKCVMKECMKNSDCNGLAQPAFCCGLNDGYTCFPVSMCNPKKEKGGTCGENAMCLTGQCNALWDAGPTSQCDDKRDQCSHNSDCDQEVAYCCGLVETSCGQFGKCTSKKNNGESCGENAACFSGHCNGVFESGKTGHCDNRDKDCKLGQCGEWDLCSKSCGGGVQHRTRVVRIPTQGKGKACDTLTDEAPCNQDACCSLSGQECAKDEDCCEGSGSCNAGVCSICKEEGEQCEKDDDCCDDYACKDGKCSKCKEEGEECEKDNDCCDPYSCNDGKCSLVCDIPPLSGVANQTSVGRSLMANGASLLPDAWRTNYDWAVRVRVARPGSPDGTFHKLQSCSGTVVNNYVITAAHCIWMIDYQEVHKPRIGERLTGCVSVGPLKCATCSQQKRFQSVAAIVSVAAFFAPRKDIAVFQLDRPVPVTNQISFSTRVPDVNGLYRIAAYGANYYRDPFDQRPDDDPYDPQLGQWQLRTQNHNVLVQDGQVLGNAWGRRQSPPHVTTMGGDSGSAWFANDGGNPRIFAIHNGLLPFDHVDTGIQFLEDDIYGSTIDDDVAAVLRGFQFPIQEASPKWGSTKKYLIGAVLSVLLLGSAVVCFQPCRKDSEPYGELLVAGTCEHEEEEQETTSVSCTD